MCVYGCVGEGGEERASTVRSGLMKVPVECCSKEIET